jgi:hypothetical protein
MSQISGDALLSDHVSPAVLAGPGDRRKSARVPLPHPVKVGPPREAPEALVSARDLSADGMFIDADRPVRVGARFSAELTLPDGQTLYVAQAEVAYNRDHAHGAGFGVRFVDIDPVDRALIEAEVARFTRAELGSTTLIPSILEARPETLSELPTLAPSPSQLEDLEAILSLPPEPAFGGSSVPSGFDLTGDLALPEPEDADEGAKDARRAARALPSALARYLPGALVLGGLAAVISVAVGLLFDSSGEALAVEPTGGALSAGTQAVLMGETQEVQPVSPAPADAPAADAPKKPLPPLVVLDEAPPAPATAAPTPAPTPAPAGAPKVAAKPEAPQAAAKPEAPKAVAKPEAPKAAAPKAMSPAAQAILGEGPTTFSLPVSPGVRVVRTHVLHAPERFVIDLSGQDAPLTPPAPQGVVSQVRVGKHPEYTRVVVDVQVPLQAGQAELLGGRLQVRLHPR